MFSTILSLSSLLPVPATNVAPVPIELVSCIDDEFDRRLEEAGKDVKKLWELYLWCDSSERNREARKTALRIIKNDPDHEEARAALGHEYFDGKWFKTQKKLVAYKKKKEERTAKEQGLVRYEDGWVPKEDLPFLEKGMVRNDEKIEGRIDLYPGAVIGMHDGQALRPAIGGIRIRTSIPVQKSIEGVGRMKVRVAPQDLSRFIRVHGRRREGEPREGEDRHHDELTSDQ